MRKYLFAFLTVILVLIQTQAQAQKNVTGTVTGVEDNDPIAGVQVIVQGSQPMVYTITDGNGTFSINVPQGYDNLTFNALGRNSKTIAVGNATNINVQLSAGSQSLDAVVVVGYGTMKKSDVTGAVASVKGADLQKAPAGNLTQALQGRVAGVTVNANSGQPGSEATVRIRGIGTLNNSSPVYVVDGIIVSDISFINANDIESSEVLKDASAAAIYGSRGANGVIIITTKKGGQQKGKISVDAYAGIQSRWKKLDVMGRDEFAKTLVMLADVPSEMAIFNDGKGFSRWLKTYRLGTSSPYYPTNFDYSKQETDWQDEVFRQNAPIQSYNLSFEGGDETKQYALSAGYFDQQGTIIGSYYKRLTVRANTSYKIRKWLTVGENMTYMTSTYRNAPNNSGSAGASILTAALAMAPWDPTHYPEGSVNNSGEDIGLRPSAASNFKNVTNPFSTVEMNHPMDYSDRVVGDVYLDLSPIKGLSIRSSVSLDFALNRSRSFGDAYEFSTYDKRNENFLSSSLSRYYTLTNQNIITYSRTIKEHSFSAMVGHTAEEYNYYYIGNSGSTILVPTPENWYLSQTTDNNTNPAGDGVDRTRMISFLGRLHYSYDNRYLVTVNFRADGSSKFPEHRWGYFPSAAVGWRISQEKFMKDVKGLDELKLRLGWGQLGNQSSVGSSDFMQGINSGMYFSSYILGQSGASMQTNGSVDDGQSAAQGASVNTWVNQNGKWEVTEQWNVAVDWGVLHNRLSGTVDMFRRTTKEMFLFVSAPSYTGNLFSPKANVGTVRNDGIELSLQWQDSKNKFNYSIGGNVSFIKNRLDALNGGYPVYGDRVISDVGLGLYTYYGYEYLGMYSTDDEAAEHLYATTAGTYRAGDAKYRDLNNDGKITNEDDRTELGNPFPWLTYGINASVDFWGFDLQLFLQGVYGNELYNAQRETLEGTGNATVMSTSMRNVWTPSNPDGTIPNPRNAVNFYTSSRFIESGAYLRLKNLQIGYTLPQNITQKAFISRFRIYFSASNLFTITKYSGYDPEVGSGVDYGNYPQARTFLFGINLDF
ncbi:MAG: TonB-dependent receptor [Bacteroidales bacterium]|jgi:TonB-linked SusC/RagA family outer membrane protein|nr:TonB-dependent receptor [Bacteroidales bacterium]